MRLRTKILSGYLAVAIVAVLLSGIAIQYYAHEGQVAAVEPWALVAGLAIICAMVSVGLGLLLSNCLVSTIDRLNRMARALSAGERSDRTPVREGGDELDVLAGSLNEMAGWFEENMRQLHEFKQKYFTSVEYASDGMVILQDEKFIFCNSAFTGITGYSLEELVNGQMHYDDIIAPDKVDMARDRYQKIMKGELSPKMEEIKMVRKDGSIRHLEINSAVIEYNKETALLSILRDVTEKRAYQENLRRLSEQIIETQEEERKRIAHELHDEIGQTLTAININMEFLEKYTDMAAVNQKFAKICSDVKKLALTGIDDIHRISFNLRPHLLDTVGLVSAIRWFTEDFYERTGVRVQLQVEDEEEHLPPLIETLIYRITQEALTNVIRHAQATQVVIRFRSSEAGITLVIEDNGKGSNVENTLGNGKRQGLGIFGMRERVSTFGGKFTICPGESGGTRLLVELPNSSEGTA